MQERALVRERRVVNGRHVPDEVRGEPEREGEEGVRHDADCCRTLELARKRWRQREHDEPGRPLGGDDVLKQMNGEQVMQGDRVQGRHVDREEQDHPDVEGDPTSRIGRPPALAPEIEGGECADRKEHVPMQRPRVRIHAATLLATRARGVVVAPEISNLLAPVRARSGASRIRHSRYVF
jgi:hypothetical protein